MPGAHPHPRRAPADLRLPDGTAPAQGFALIVVDLSFIAASHLLDKLATLAAPAGRLACLIKPQFELGPQARNRRASSVPTPTWTACAATSSSAQKTPAGRSTTGNAAPSLAATATRSTF
ncbi:hypothetical protein V8H18_04545 [Lautropia mirabilis]